LPRCVIASAIRSPAVSKSASRAGKVGVTATGCAAFAGSCAERLAAVVTVSSTGREVQAENAPPQTVIAIRHRTAVRRRRFDSSVSDISKIVLPLRFIRAYPIKSFNCDS
jgi:hypothetical protein